MTTPAHPAIDPRRTALLAMDFQNGILAHVPESDALVERVKGAMADLRAVGGTIGYVRGTFEDPQTYADLRARLEQEDKAHGTRGNRIFYLAVGPDEMIPIVKGLAKEGLLTESVREGDGKRSFARLIVEKPFGEDLATAHKLNRELFEHAAESQIYRIDHYLGKETVQNMMVLRFENSMFEAVWNRHNVSYVEITVAEDIGIEGRGTGTFYDQTDPIRDASRTTSSRCSPA